MAAHVPIPPALRQPLGLRQIWRGPYQNATGEELPKCLFKGVAHRQGSFANCDCVNGPGIDGYVANRKMRAGKLYGAPHSVFGIHAAERFVKNFFGRGPKLRKIGHSTVIKSCNARKRLSLMPRMMIKYSGLRNGPYFSRCSTIRVASPLPMPGSFSSSFAGAVLILIFVVGCLFVSSFVAFD